MSLNSTTVAVANSFNLEDGAELAAVFVACLVFAHAYVLHRVLSVNVLRTNLSTARGLGLKMFIMTFPVTFATMLGLRSTTLSLNNACWELVPYSYLIRCVCIRTTFTLYHHMTLLSPPIIPWYYHHHHQVHHPHYTPVLPAACLHCVQVVHLLRPAPEATPTLPSLDLCVPHGACPDACGLDVGPQAWHPVAWRVHCGLRRRLGPRPRRQHLGVPDTGV